MIPKIIKNEVEYDAILARITELMDAEAGTAEGDELELLATLTEIYEQKVHPIEPPTPVDAIKFRMEQMGLKPKDMVPYFGSRSKVSEVLSGRRTLSLSMIRKLREGLNIPADVLVREKGKKISAAHESVDWQRFPLSEMLKRNWFPDFEGTLSVAKEHAEELLSAWAAPLGPEALQPALLRQHVYSGSEADEYALAAWRIRVSLLAMNQSIPGYRPRILTPSFMADLVRLSYLDHGPLLAKEFLLKSGIHFVVEGHLPHTHLDGAAIRLPDGSPLVAMTLRYDRVDNFWFTLFHELAHVALHFDGEHYKVFFDDLDRAAIDDCEREADEWATEALIPTEVWRNANMRRNTSAKKVVEFATGLRISPAIPAGRIRKEHNDYGILSNLVGHRKVRMLFADRCA